MADLGTVVLGLVAWLPVQLLGRIYVGELLLLVCALAFPFAYARTRVSAQRQFLTWFFGLGALYLGALILTDVYRQTPFDDHARGWARAFFYLANVAGLVVISNGGLRRLVLFVAGSALSHLLVQTIAGGGGWKFGYAYPVTMLVLVLLDSRRAWPSLIVLTLLGFVHLLLDFRLFAALGVLVGFAAYLKADGRRTARAAAPIIAVLLIAGFVGVYRSGAAIAGSAEDVARRRLGSNVQRAAGLLVAAEAIRETPLIGHGSWPRSQDALSRWASVQAEAMGATSAQIEQRALTRPEGAAIRAHSMVLQAWLEAGVVGLLFFGFAIVALARMLYRLVLLESAERHFALLCFVGLWMLWALVMSPFAGDSRLLLALALVLLVRSRPEAPVPRAMRR